MTDMSRGNPHSHLWRYALPLLLGNWLQLSYNAADSIIAGRFIGQEALAAEGIAGPVMNLVILAISGVCIGSGVLMSEAFGGKDMDKLRKTLANTLLFGLLLCCGVALAGILLASQILSLLSVPAEIRDITTTYLRITFLGAPFTFCYNALAAGLKSVGDSKTPLKFLAFSAILNALLDLIFLGLLDFGVICSAVTTVFAEAVCALVHGCQSAPIDTCSKSMETGCRPAAPDSPLRRPHRPAAGGAAHRQSADSGPGQRPGRQLHCRFQRCHPNG